MLIIVLYIAVLALGAVLINKYEYKQPAVIGGILATISGVVLVFLLIALPVSRLADADNIRDYQSKQKMVEYLRGEETDPIERAALYREILDLEAWRVNAVYWNATVFDIWRDDRVDELEPMR